jgi:hypothetical protein
MAYVQESTPVGALKPLCFVISRIGTEGSEIRKTSDKILKHIITKPLNKKYRIERADEISKPGLITVQIIQRLRDAELVIADLSGGNPNVYYELAIRHYVAKPIIHIITAGEEAPFDVNQMRFVAFNIADPDSIESAQSELLLHVEALEKGEKVVTPIQVAHILAEPVPTENGSEVADVLNALYGAVGNLQQEIRSTREFAQALYEESPARSNALFGVATFRGPSTLNLSTLAAMNLPLPAVAKPVSRIAQSMKEAKSAEESTSRNPAESSKDNT